MNQEDNEREIRDLKNANLGLSHQMEADAQRIAELKATVERLASAADESTTLINKLFAERDRLREVLFASLPILRMADKACSTLYPRDDTPTEFIRDRDPDKGYLAVYLVRSEAYKALGVDS